MPLLPHLVGWTSICQLVWSAKQATVCSFPAIFSYFTCHCIYLTRPTSAYASVCVFKDGTPLSFSERKLMDFHIVFFHVPEGAPPFPFNRPLYPITSHYNHYNPKQNAHYMCMFPYFYLGFSSSMFRHLHPFHHRHCFHWHRPRKAPVNFGGVLIFVDGERFPEDSLQEAWMIRWKQTWIYS